MNNLSKYYYDDLNTLFKQVVPAGYSSSKIFKIKGSLKKYDYVLLPNTFAYTKDIQSFISDLKKKTKDDTKVVVVYFNSLWKPLLDLLSLIGLRVKPNEEPNWLSIDDISNLFMLEDYQEIKRGKRMIFPLDLGPVSAFINKYIAPLPIINSFCLTTYQIYKPKRKEREYSVSIIIPARNEEGNMKGVLKKIPVLGKWTEVVFVEGGSSDNTYKTIENEIKKNKTKIKAKLFKQKGKGKGDAVRLGYSKAIGDILMILDADLTVDPKDLPKFYSALKKGYGDFANGERLVYPMEKQAMRTLNYLGNTFFGWAFSYLLGQRLKDTLCGTKVLFSSDYKRLAKNRKAFGDFDPFGDFDLLFGASALNLKIVEIPIRYKERTYGTTNISRFKHGVLLFKMTFFAARKIKFV